MYRNNEGREFEVRDELPLDLAPGDGIVVPLTKTPYFGTPELNDDEYWAMAPWATFRVNAKGAAIRPTGQALADRQKIPNQFTLSALEKAVTDNGMKSSAID